ncbi:DUF192 domain-containing protein [Treponema primitia]|uniref:DUF192 domain-containing protein n=1 Tax=Treponema primitia TaxID=88058 RepID=UPI0002554D2C|nr:DUF192 domain-containing protein [Treponema primitia]
MKSPRRRRYYFAVLVCIALFFCAALNCAAGGSGSQSRLETLELHILRSDGTEAPILAEIARTEDQRTRGLMGRKSLADGQGMLFVFERDHILSFWMKNTLIPLSIAYIAYDGRILEIHDMQPQSLRTIQSSRSARYALEVPQGWFTRAGIKPGDVLGPNLPKE